MITLLMDGRGAQQVAATVEQDDLWVDAAELSGKAGWSLEPQGLCQGEMCVPIPPGQRDHWLRGTAVNLAALWQHLDRPLLRDEPGTTWVFGAGAQERSEQLRNLEAPDFELPDLSGKLHRLSDLRGKRVFLVTWASW